MTYSAGSFQADIVNLIPNLPASLSGTNLNPLLNRAVFYFNSYTGESISGNSVSDSYVPIIFSLMASEVCQLSHLQGLQSASASIGDYSENKNKSSPLIIASEEYKKQAIDMMNDIGRRFNYYKSLG